MLKSEKNLPPSVPFVERRKYPRAPVRSVAYTELDDDNAGLILNVSEGGVGVQSAEMIISDRFQRMILRLPKTEKWIEAGGKLAWISPSRKEAGIRFVDLSEDACQQIQSWIHSSTFGSGMPIDQGHFKIVWESEEPEMAADVPVPKTAPSDIETMFPSEKTVPPRHRSAMDNIATVATPSHDLEIAPGPVKRTVVSASVKPAMSEQASAPRVTPPIHAEPQEPSAPARRSFHYPPLPLGSGSARDPFAPIAQERSAVASAASAALGLGSTEPPSLHAPSAPVAPAFPLREHYRELGYNPTPFEEPSGRGWIVAAVILVVLLGIGSVVAIGPENVKSLLAKRWSSLSAGALPPPVGALRKSEEASSPGSNSMSASGPLGGAPPEPLTNPGVDPPPQEQSAAAPAKEPATVDAPATIVIVTGRANPKPTVHDSASQPLPRREGAILQETREDAKAITRRFQMEHSSANSQSISNSYPTTPYQSSPRESLGSSPTRSPAPSLVSETKPDRTLDSSVPPIAPPAATPPANASSGAAGAVAISSHFRSLRGEDPEVTRERQGLSVGQLISIRQPSYPVEAERSRTEGIVQLRATVDQLGKVEIVHAVSGPPQLLAAAIDAVREWRYAPTTLNGKAVESVDDVNIVFRLGNSAAWAR